MSRYFLFSSAILMVVFAWMEPSGAAGLGFGLGLLFWLAQLGILMPLLIGLQIVTCHSLRRTTRYQTLGGNPWVQTTIAGLAGGSLFVPFAYGLDLLFGVPEESEHVTLIAGLFDEAAGVVIPVAVTWVALNAPWICQLNFAHPRNGPLPIALEHAEVKEAPCTENPRFMTQVRNQLGGEIISLSSELHYVRVTTTEGNVLVLYNLRDAVEELCKDSGIQVHRSHWVAREHIRSVKSVGGNLVCELSDGRTLPVSRRKRALVEGWLTTNRASSAESSD